MYLNHLAILRWITPSVSRTAERITGATSAGASVALIVTVACSVFFSAVLFVAVERPFLDVREKFIGRRSLAGAPVAAPVERPAAPAGAGEVVPVVAIDQPPPVVTEIAKVAETGPVNDQGTSASG
jgi:peptidoglycan/LPS O-acetylase OafA/YrhL